MRKTLMPAAIAICGLLAGSPAFAGGQAWQVGHDSFHIRFNDLDLRTPAGRAQALARVEKAAVRICRSNNLGVDRAACEADIIAAAGRGPMSTTIRQALSERREQAWAMAKSK